MIVRKRSRAREEMTYIPNNLVREILIRLPIKSLLRCRRVCPTWRILIQELCFADLHQNPYNTPLAFFSNPKCLCLLNLDPPIHYHDTYNLKRQVVNSISSCNGLLCYALRYRTLHVINPITKQHLSLPKSPLQLDNRSITSSYGIGFHAATNEYKVVLITQRWETAQDMEIAQAEIWTLGRSTSWRRFGKIPYYSKCSSGSAGFFVQGALHWWMYDDDNQLSLVSMNMGSENISAIELSFRSSEDSSVRMIEWSGRLSVAEQVPGLPRKRCCYNIWVLKDHPREEGMTVNWSKELSFEWDDESVPQHRHPLCVQKNGEILALESRDSKLVSYNIEKRSFTHVKTLPLRVRLQFMCNAVQYVPSFAGWKQAPKRKKDQVGAEHFDRLRVKRHT